MNADGSDKQQAVFDPYYDAQSDWSPDGTRIVFRSRPNDTSYQISIVDFRVRDAAGRPVTTEVTRPTDGTQSSQPAWFPDMTGIVYRRTNAPVTTAGDIWAMDPDGTNRRVLYAGPGHQWYPSLSPDKTKLLFSTTIQGNNRNIQVMDMATGVVTTLFDTPGNDSAPAWSPDGRRIAFESDGELYLMDADGANVQRLTNNTVFEEGPAWSPDGTRLAFSSAPTNTDNDIWTMAVDGTDKRRLTNSPQPEESPDWGRNPGPATVGGTVPATLALSLAGAVSLGTFIPGIAREYTASTTATVTSTAGSATLNVSDPGHLTNGAFTLAQPLRVAMTPAAWAQPVSNATAAISFKQPIGATDPLRTGTYTKTLTFTLATTEP